MKLKKFTIKNNVKTSILVLGVICILLITLSFFLRSFAIYEDVKNFKIINATIPDPGDVLLSYYLDGNFSNQIPSRLDNYMFDAEHSQCNNGVGVGWDKQSWSAVLDFNSFSNLNNQRTKCSLAFKTVQLSNFNNQVVTIANNTLTSGDSDTVINLGDVEVDGVVSCSNTLAYDEDDQLRYVGASPCNYVQFGGRLWRIIGFFGDTIKLLSLDSIGEMAWDTSSENGGYGINQWGDTTLTSGASYQGSSLKIYLNGIFLNSLTDSSSIQDVTWFIGNSADVHDDNYKNADVYTFYLAERSSAAYTICGTSPYCTDTVQRTPRWTGKVGLMYISDYAYATGQNRGTCLHETLLSNYSTANCNKDNWIPDGNYQWTLTLLPNHGNASTVFRLSGSGGLGNKTVNILNHVRPSIYLSSSVNFLSGGDGSLGNPYQIYIP